jgi:hypothetical protein
MQKYLSPKEEEIIKTQSCKDISYKEHLLLGDKLQQIKSTFRKFMEQNDEIRKSTKWIKFVKDLPVTDLYKLPNLAIGFGVLKGILTIKTKEQMRYWLRKIAE